MRAEQALRRAPVPRPFPDLPALSIHGRRVITQLERHRFLPGDFSYALDRIAGRVSRDRLLCLVCCNRDAALLPVLLAAEAALPRRDAALLRHHLRTHAAGLNRALTEWEFGP